MSLKVSRLLVSVVFGMSIDRATVHSVCGDHPYILSTFFNFLVVSGICECILIRYYDKNMEGEGI